MNSLTIIGNVTRDPETRVTPSGKEVTNFTVAVNRRHSPKAGVEETDYFRVTAWDKLAGICKQYLIKGSKVAVVGSVSVSTYEKNGNHYASLDVTANQIELLGGKRSDADDSGLTYTAPPVQKDKQTGFVKVDDDDFLPF